MAVSSPSSIGNNNNSNDTTALLSTTTTSHMGVVVTSKLNGRQLRFTTANYQDTGRAFEALQNYAFPGRRNLGYLFAFESKREKVLASVVQVDDATAAAGGQPKTVVTLEPCRRRYDAVAEFQRQMGGSKTTVAHNNNSRGASGRPPTPRTSCVCRTRLS